MADRTRTCSCDDPLQSLARSRGLTGLEALQLISTGAVPPPPIAMTLGLGRLEVSNGMAAFEIESTEFHDARGTSTLLIVGS